MTAKRSVLSCWKSVSVAGCVMGVVACLSPRVAQAQYASLEVKTSKETHLGSAFLVSDEGYVATSFTLLEHATAANVLPGGGHKYKVTGFVAASRGHDIVLLAVEHPPKELVAPELSREAAPQPGDPLVISPGPKSPAFEKQFSGRQSPAFQAQAAPPSENKVDLAQPSLSNARLFRSVTAAEFLAGWEPLAPQAPGQALDTSWLLFNTSFDPSYAGAPIVAGDGRIVAMLSGPTGPERRPRLAVHARHIDDVLQSIKDEKQPAPHRLVELAKYSDPLDDALLNDAAQPTGAAADNRLAAQLAFGRDRCAKWEKAYVDLHDAIDAARKDELPPRQTIDDDERKIDSEKKNPMEVYEEEEVEREKDKDGKTETVRKKVQRRRLSPQQQQKIMAWEKEIAGCHDKLSSLESLVRGVTEYELPFAKRSLARAERDVFTLADPCDLADEHEHRALKAALDDAIAAGNAPALFHLARGLCRLTLGELDEAQSDLAQAVEADAALAHMAEMAEGRRLLLSGKKSAADQKIAQAVKAAAQAELEVRRLAGPKGKKGPVASPTTHVDPNKAMLYCLNARVELDLGHGLKAAALLEKTLAADGDPAKTNAALAWLYASPPSGMTANPRKALDHAHKACDASHQRDWFCLAAMAAAQSRDAKFDDAQASLARARMLAPDGQKATLDAWVKQLAAEQPLSRDWKVAKLE